MKKERSQRILFKFEDFKQAIFYCKMAIGGLQGGQKIRMSLLASCISVQI